MDLLCPHELNLETTSMFRDMRSSAVKVLARSSRTLCPNSVLCDPSNASRITTRLRQYVAACRPSISLPPLILCSVAFFQDAESEASVQQALDTLVERGAGSTTVVLVAHR